MSEDWKDIYSPIKWIKEDWYKLLDQEISDSEWSLMLSELKSNTALGILGISYTLIKNVASTTQRIFRKFTDLCLAS
ncbi:22905_t:CDS:1, partial [Gigaspora rosea]